MPSPEEELCGECSPKLRSCACFTCLEPSSAAKQRAVERENPQAAYWRHRWRLPGPGSPWTLSGHSRALERTGFLLEESKIFLDAGVAWRSPTSTPLAILVTHGHIDHVNALPMLLRCNGDPAVFVPQDHLNGVREMCRMTWSVKRRDGTRGAGQRQDLEPPVVGEPHSRAVGIPAEEVGLRDPVPKEINARGRLWVPVNPGASVVLPGKQRLLVRTVECFHTVDDIGYIVCEVKKVLRGTTPEAQVELDALYQKTDKRSVGQAIGALRKSGAATEIDEIVAKVAFLCDTTIQVFGRCQACQAGDCPCPFASTPYGRACLSEQDAARQSAAILTCPAIIVECSFLGAGGMSEQQSEEEAISRGHVSWAQLRPVVLNSPGTTFVLVHFSERYTDDQIREYFWKKEMPRNIVLWLDSGVTDLSVLP